MSCDFFFCPPPGLLDNAYLSTKGHDPWSGVDWNVLTMRVTVADNVSLILSFI